MTARKWQFEPQSIPEARSPSGSWFPARTFSYGLRGAKGRWYRDLANGGPATLEFNGEQLAVQAVPATDAGSVERASQEFLSKYRSSPYAASIVRQDVLETTLRLDPQ